MPRSSRSLALLAVLCLVVGCGEGEFAPRLGVDGPSLRKRIQRRDVAASETGSGSSVSEEQRREGTAHGLGSEELVGDPARIPLTSPERAALDAEYWAEETFAVELTADQLHALRRLVTGDADRSSLAAVFTEDARVADPALRTMGAQTVSLEVTRASWIAAEATLDPAAWFDAAAAWRSSLSRVRWITLLPTFVAFEDGEARVDVDWQVAVELADGGLRHDVGTWTGTWVPTGERSDRPTSSLGWRCRELRPVEGLRYEAPYAAFVDVSLEALGGTSMSPLIPRAPEGKEHYRGVVLADVDADDDLDIVCAIPNTLLLNDGSGNFTEATTSAGIVQEMGFTGVQVADFDRDGDVDIVFTAKRRHALVYLQEQRGKFRGVPIRASRNDNHPASVTAHDVDRDGWLDLFICGYGPLVNPGPDRAYDATNARNNQMLKGGPRGFVDVTEPWGLWGESSRWAFIGSFGDVDDDGDDDLYVANDFGPNVLYRRVQVDPPRFKPEIEPLERYDASFSMSATWADLDGDLDLDMYVSNMESTEARRIERLPGNVEGDPRDIELRRIMSHGNAVLLNGGEPLPHQLDEQPNERGARDAKWAWGTALFDWDLDGDLDIQCVNGFRSIGIDDGRDWDSVWWRWAAADMKRHPGLWVESMTRHYPESALEGWSWDGFQRSVFYLNEGDASFEQIAPVLGLDQVADGRALAMGDIDRDGDLDLVGGNVNAPHLYVLRNDTRVDASFVSIELTPSENRSAAGARILVTAGGRTQRRDVALGEGFVSQHEIARWFGLADAERIEEVEVLWPDGTTSTWNDLAANRRYRLDQESGEVTELALRERNFNGTFRLGETEWTNDPRQIELIPEPWVDEALAAAVTPPAIDPEAEGVRAVVLHDPDHESSRGELAKLAELTDMDGLEVVLVTPTGATAPAIDGVALATWTGDAEREALLASLAQWCGTHHLPWPITLYVRGGTVAAVSRSAIVPERVRAFCELR